MDTTVINDPEALKDLCQHLQQQRWVALDTEFMRERTYYPQLCLLQLATEERIACVDPLALNDIEPLLSILLDRKLLKVLHSARQDLELFFNYSGQTMGPIFDTQIAAALCGHAVHIGYAKLVQAITGTELAKAHTRANWAARPLSSAMLQYAVDDVHYLRPVYHSLDDTLTQLQRHTWMQEECERLEDPALYRNPPELSYLRIKQGHTLAPAAQQVLRQLAAWRERMAHQRDLPRNWVARDNSLLLLARLQPQQPADFAQLPATEAKLIKKWGQDLVTAMKPSTESPDQTLWPQPQPLSESQKQRSKELLRELEHIAERHGLHSAIIASKKDIKAIALGEVPALLQQGWRRELLGELLEIDD